MVARIYKPAKTAMQSGTARTKSWVLEYEPEKPRGVEPLMGWISSGDMKQQIRMTFPSKEDAVAYAKRNGVAYEVMAATKRKLVRKSYADNFRFGRPEPWTH